MGCIADRHHVAGCVTNETFAAYIWQFFGMTLCQMCIYATPQHMICGLQAKESGGWSKCLGDRLPWQLLGEIQDMHGCARPCSNSEVLPDCCKPDTSSTNRAGMLRTDHSLETEASFCILLVLDELESISMIVAVQVSCGQSAAVLW